MDTQLVDTHTHLQNARFDNDFESVISRTQQANMKVIVIGWDLESSQRAIELATQYEFIYATVGLSHYSANDMNDDLLNKLSQLAQKEGVVAIGETGLDYYRMAASIPSQQRLFRAQIQLASSLSLPVVVHDRDAHKDIVSILKEEEAYAGVIHCFSGDEAMIKEVLDIDFYISLSGIITFSKPLAQLIKQIPLDKLLVETDCPYLAPIPKRGKRNEPIYLKYIIQKISEILDLTYEEVVQINETNANNLFKLKDR
ncbi:MAG: TatD family hydrolase [Promethearchaeota archaeon]